MKEKIFSLVKEPLIAGSLWIAAGNFFISIGNYLYNLLMGRLLLPAEYGVLVSLISFSIVISLPAGVVTTIITKLSAHFFARKEISKISRLAQTFTSLTLVGVLIVIIFFSFGEFYIRSFLNIEDTFLIFITGSMVALGLVSSVNQGILRGLLFFKLLAALGILTVLIKLGLGWYLVTQQWAVLGALLAIFIASILSWFLSFVPIKKFYLPLVKQSLGLRKKIFDISLPTFSVTTMTLFFLSSDVLLVKHFFPATLAGIYAAVSVMGKVIFYVIGSILTVFFPIVAQKFAQGNQWIRELVQGLLLVSIPGIIGVLIYFLYPDVVLKIFFPKKEYYQAASFIGLYSIYMLLFSLASLLTNFYLAIEREKLTYIALFGALLQILLITIFHDTISKVILMSIVSIGLIVLIQSIYLGKLLLSYEKV